MLNQNDEAKNQQIDESKQQKNSNEKAMFDLINHYQKKNVNDDKEEELNKMVVGDEMNKIFESSNEVENSNSTMSIDEFKVIMEKAERLIDINSEK